MRPHAVLGRLAVAVPLLLGVTPAPAQREPIGPCSPYAATDGEIPSELPGCARRRRPEEGSLADELAFRRRAGRPPAEDDDPIPADDGPAPRHRR